MATGSGIFDIPNIGDSPCVNCKERSIGCHSTCEDYVSWRNLLDASKKLYLTNLTGISFRADSINVNVLSFSA